MITKLITLSEYSDNNSMTEDTGNEYTGVMALNLRYAVV